MITDSRPEAHTREVEVEAATCCLGFRVWGLGFESRHEGFGLGFNFSLTSPWFGLSGMGFGVWGLGLRFRIRFKVLLRLGYRVWGLRFGCRVWGVGFGIWGLGVGFGVWGLGTFRVQGHSHLLVALGEHCLNLKPST